MFTRFLAEKEGLLVTLLIPLENLVQENPTMLGMAIRFFVPFLLQKQIFDVSGKQKTYSLL